MQLFTNTLAPTRVISATGALMLWHYSGSSDNNMIPFLVNRFNATFGREVNPIYPINSAGTVQRINIMGRPNGTLQITGLATYGVNVENLKEFLQAASSNCGNKTVDIELIPGVGDCTDSALNDTIKTIDLSYKILGATLSTLAISMENGNNGLATVSQTLQFSFTGLDVGNGR